MKNYNQIIMIGAAVVCAIGLACVSYVSGYMRHSYELALGTLEMCIEDGGYNCHIERDGMEYNVYSYEFDN